MKTINRFFFSAVLLAGSLSVGSCIDLEPVDYSEINTSIFPQTEADIETMVNACYYSVRASWFDGLFATNERGVTIVNDLTTEILSCKSGFLKDISDLNYFPTTADLTRFYYTNTDAYSDGWVNDVSRCTTTLKQIEDASFLSEEQKIQYAAEVRCARGLIAYTLYDMFGPITVAPIDVLLNPTSEISLPRLSQEEMVEFIESDLKYAAAHLPMPGAVEYGRFSQGLANMLLIRLYLHEVPSDASYYDEVETLARDLMGGVYGYELEESYPAMFELNGQGVSNTEIIWAIPVSTEQISWNDWHSFTLPNNFDDHGMGAGYESVNSTWAFYDSFEPEDTRKTYLVSSYVANDGTVVDRNNPGTHLDAGPAPLKYGYDANLTANGGKSMIDPIIYRYADVYLSLAEALYLKSSSTATDKEEARELINTIRARAGLEELPASAIATNELFIEALLLERSHEFWCENGQYRADLIRLGKFVEHARDIKGTSYAEEYKKLYPLPLAAINDGKGQVIQNEGYN